MVNYEGIMHYLHMALRLGSQRHSVRSSNSSCFHQVQNQENSRLSFAKLGSTALIDSWQPLSPGSAKYHKEDSRGSAFLVSHKTFWQQSSSPLRVLESWCLFPTTTSRELPFSASSSLGHFSCCLATALTSREILPYLKLH